MDEIVERLKATAARAGLNVVSLKESEMVIPRRVLAYMLGHHCQEWDRCRRGLNFLESSIHTSDSSVASTRKRFNDFYSIGRTMRELLDPEAPDDGPMGDMNWLMEWAASNVS